MSYVIKHSRPEVGLFAGMTPAGLYAWTANCNGVSAAMCYPTLEIAEVAIAQLTSVGIFGATAAECVADMVCEQRNIFGFASPSAVYAALGAEWAWINEGVFCHGNS